MSSEQETNANKDTQIEEKGKVISMNPIQVEPKKEQLTADGQKILPDVTLNIIPVAKPRMTQSDKWKKRKATDKYWQFKDELNQLCAICRWKPKEVLHIKFVIPMPISWSKKKKERMDGQPHKQKPDLDNLVKAFKDSLLKEDSHVHTYGKIQKIWGRRGQIIVPR
jgi:Holliday junction resolvase RusA-like endonuclease